MSVGNEPVGPDPNSALVMSVIDRWSPAMRKLVHEYGYVIVQQLRDEGFTTVRELTPILKSWRRSRQAEWLATNYVTSLKLFREYQ